VGVAIMAEVAGMVEVVGMVEVAGMGVSGSGQDGADGVLGGGGVLRTIRTIIHTIRKHQRSPNSSLRYMSSQRNSITGISAGSLRATILT